MDVRIYPRSAAPRGVERPTHGQRKQRGDGERRERQRRPRRPRRAKCSGSTNASMSAAFSNGRKPRSSPRGTGRRGGSRAASDRSRAGTGSRAGRRRRSRRVRPRPETPAARAARARRRPRARLRSAPPRQARATRCMSRTAANTLCIFSSPTRLFSSAERASPPAAKKPCHVGAPNAASEAAENAAAVAAPAISVVHRREKTSANGIASARCGLNAIAPKRTPASAGSVSIANRPPPISAALKKPFCPCAALTNTAGNARNATGSSDGR